MNWFLRNDHRPSDAPGAERKLVSLGLYRFKLQAVLVVGFVVGEFAADAFPVPIAGPSASASFLFSLALDAKDCVRNGLQPCRWYRLLATFAGAVATFADTIEGCVDRFLRGRKSKDVLGLLDAP